MDCSWDSLVEDCKEQIFQIITEDEDRGPFTLYSCTFVNSKWNRLAVKFLYKDTWIFIKGGRLTEPIRAQQLINTYLSCLSASPRSPDGPHQKRRCVAHRWNYIELAKNLHIPALYECVIRWHVPEISLDITPEEKTKIDEVFFRLYKAFLAYANLQECTFYENPFPVTPPLDVGHLKEIATELHNNNVELRYLNLGFFNCNDEALQALTGKITSLKTFKIKADACSDESLAAFLSSQRRLTKLKIRKGTNIHQTIEALRTQAGTLVKLRILGCDLSSCSGPFTSIAACRGLRSLYMNHVTFPPDISPSDLLMPIARNCIFHNIDFTRTFLPGDVLEEIARTSSTTLRRVIIKRPRLTYDDDGDDMPGEDCGAGIRALADHAPNLMTFERDILPDETGPLIYLLSQIGPSLDRLLIGSEMLASRESSDIIHAIAQNCPSLTALDISFFNFSPESFKQLTQRCRQIKYLYLYNNPSVNDQLLKLLEGNKTLKYLAVTECNVSDETLRNLEDWIDDVETDYNPFY